MVEHDVIIIGGGHNGLVCAFYLARAGLDVLVLERRHVVGGACATEEVFPGYAISTCSYIVYLLQDKVVRDMQLYKHGYLVQQLPAKRFFPFPDGRSLFFWNSTEETCREIAAKYTERDAAGYRRWQDFWTQTAHLVGEYFLQEPPTLDEWITQIRGTSQEAHFERLQHCTLRELMDDCFESDEVKAAAIAHVVDADGLDTPGVLMGYAINKTNRLVDPRNQGLAIGGMGTLSAAMARAAQHAGARIRCGAEVKRILIENDRAVGVELVDGQLIRSKQVVSNADPKRTFLGLIDKGYISPAVEKSIQGLRTTCGTFKFHASVSELPDFSRYLGQDFDPTLIADVGIGPSTAYYSQALQDALDGRPARQPLVDVQTPTVIDRTIAPEGKHIVSMWVRFEPVHPKGATWDKLRQQEGERLIDLLTEYAPNFRRSILDWALYTPADIERRIYMTDGNFRHTDHAGHQAFGNRLFSRGGHRTPVAGLYMCGAGTHPGGDVSGAPGHNAAHVLLADLARE